MSRVSGAAERLGGMIIAGSRSQPHNAHSLWAPQIAKSLPRPPRASRKFGDDPGRTVVQANLKGSYAGGRPRPSKDLHRFTSSKFRARGGMDQNGFRRDVPHGPHSRNSV